MLQFQPSVLGFHPSAFSLPFSAFCSQPSVSSFQPLVEILEIWDTHRHTDTHTSAFIELLQQLKTPMITLIIILLLNWKFISIILVKDDFYLQFVLKNNFSVYLLREINTSETFKSYNIDSNYQSWKSCRLRGEI